MKKGKFSYGIRTQIFFGENCIIENNRLFKEMGNRAIIVTGRNSARKCGALDDVLEALNKEEISSVIFDEVESNPSMETVQRAAEIARKEKVEFVIGIGGGSPIDASKAISVLAANKKMAVQDLFANGFTAALPIVGIPTTAGTGSEVTPYSVILRNDIQTKVSFGNNLTYPTYALVNPKYTFELERKITVTTCIDAFMHVFEGYLANRSTPISDCFALMGIEIFGRILRKLIDYQIGEEDRNDMMLLSVLGGLVIAQSGVTIPHGMGYCYTYYKGIPHGLANGLIFEEFLKLNYEVEKEKIDRALLVMGYDTVNTFVNDFRKVVGNPPVLTTSEIENFTKQTLLQKGSISNTPYPVDENVIKMLWSNIK